MYVTNLLKSNVKGVEGSFLMKDGEVIECDLDEEKLYFLSKSILFLTGSFLESKKDLRNSAYGQPRTPLVRHVKPESENSDSSLDSNSMKSGSKSPKNTDSRNRR